MRLVLLEQADRRARACELLALEAQLVLRDLDARERSSVGSTGAGTDVVVVVGATNPSPCVKQFVPNKLANIRVNRRIGVERLFCREDDKK